MKEDMKGDPSVYMAEYVDKNLYSYSDWHDVYEQMFGSELLSEIEHLYDPKLWFLSFDFIGNRYYALLNRLIHAAVEQDKITDQQRSAFVSCAIIFRDMVFSRIEGPKLDRLKAAISASYDTAIVYGLYPKAAEHIRDGVQDYTGGYEQSSIGQILQKY